MIALFSIKPQFADKIFAGEKLYEYRKAIFKNDVKKIVVYSTKPVGKIIGEFTVADIIEDCPSLIWERTSTVSGVEEEFYQQYFDGRTKGFAINIEDAYRYEEEIDPKEVFESFTAPQSFSYLDESTYLSYFSPDKKLAQVKH